jgi:hypothetical protein
LFKLARQLFEVIRCEQQIAHDSDGLASPTLALAQDGCGLFPGRQA